MSRRGSGYDDTIVYRSKNFEAERKRRQKLSDRFLELRAVVPIITNMNKETIIEDAITYIQELQRDVKVLGDMLLEMDQETSSKEGTKKKVDEIDAAEEIRQRGIKKDFQATIVEGNKLRMKISLEKKSGLFTRLIEKMTCFGLEHTDTSFQVTIVEGNKLWMKIILEKKSGLFTRLIEKMTCFGLELTDISFTTSKGATLVSACVEVANGDTLTVQQTKELLQQIIKGI